ncbi:DUF2512 family protein [Effusibacillus dendaii]|uniref:DUF2512 family protein n=1 Tax=Effusibacillus dendaii TaxID=2743772 RepID=A0A7I8DD01_9BACL|nr:DUF2512 family protein [Effusibacillus dendaii]BCJ88093.1 hypothetical protein skT53_30780 [Effusibacillus dendaii]
MRYGMITSFLIKWVAVTAAVWFTSLFFPLHGTMNFGHVLLIGTVISIIGYISDLVISPAANQMVAIVADFVLAALIAYMGNYLLFGMNVTWTFAVILGLIVAGVEIFYHAKFVTAVNRR